MDVVPTATAVELLYLIATFLGCFIMSTGFVLDAFIGKCLNNLTLFRIVNFISGLVAGGTLFVVGITGLIAN